jgi:hypothetical protein
MKTKSIPTPANWKTAKVHPLANLVEYGSNIDVDGMTKHAKEHGYDTEEALVFFEGMLLDGRHRREMCKKLAIIPPCREFTGKNAFAYVAKKIFRQHPSVAERAKIAATLADAPSGTNQHTVGKTDGVTNGTPSMNTDQAAKALGVSKRSVQRAKAASKPANKTADKPPAKKSGQVVIDWKDFFSHFGHLVRAIDKVGNGYNCKNASEAENLRNRLDGFRIAFITWVEFHTKEKSPRF